MTTDQKDQQATDNTDPATALATAGTLLAAFGGIAWFATMSSSLQCAQGNAPGPCDPSIAWHGIGAGAFLVGAMLIVAAFVIGALRDH
jgi:hypothetical protein